MVKRGFSLLGCFLGIFAFAQYAFGCSCIINSLPKRFCQSEAIFVGRLAGMDSVVKSRVQNFDEGRPIFKVSKRLKGISQPYVAVNLDWDEIAKAGMCPTLIKFDEEEEYLIFAYGKELTIQSVCSDSRKLKSGTVDWDELTAMEIRQLGSLWFRLKARLWPF